MVRGSVIGSAYGPRPREPRPDELSNDHAKPSLVAVVAATACIVAIPPIRATQCRDARRFSQ